MFSLWEDWLPYPHILHGVISSTVVTDTSDANPANHTYNPYDYVLKNPGKAVMIPDRDAVPRIVTFLAHSLQGADIRIINRID